MTINTCSEPAQCPPLVPNLQVCPDFSCLTSLEKNLRIIILPVGVSCTAPSWTFPQGAQRNVHSPVLNIIRENSASFGKLISRLPSSCLRAGQNCSQSGHLKALQADRNVLKYHLYCLCSTSEVCLICSISC